MKLFSLFKRKPKSPPTPPIEQKSRLWYKAYGQSLYLIGYDDPAKARRAEMFPVMKDSGNCEETLFESIALCLNHYGYTKGALQVALRELRKSNFESFANLMELCKEHEIPLSLDKIYVGEVGKQKQA